MTFQEVKTEYEQQRIGLATYLVAHPGLKTTGLHIKTDGSSGKGSAHYTSRGKIPSYDLRNWKWVEVTATNGFKCIVSLNMPEIDPITKNQHSLYDRIGFVPPAEEWVYTDIDLALDNTKKEKIAQLILEQFKTQRLSV